MAKRYEDPAAQAQRYEELLRRGIEAFNRGDYDAMDESMHPDIEWDSGDTAVEGDRIKIGLEQVKRHLKPDIFESQHALVEDVIVNGNQVFVQTMFRVRAAGSGIELENRGYQVWTIDGDKARRVQLFLDRDKARAAAGLPVN
jgi:ketosteroid isomerase-like protein